MLKFLWNSNNYNIGEKDQFWGNYHKINSSTWIKNILKETEYKQIENLDDIELNDKLIIVDSYIHNKKNFYSKLSSVCENIFLFHLGDEMFHAPNITNEIYENCRFTWRTFCSNLFFDNSKVTCIAVGYKSGIKNKKISQTRKIKWSFTGTSHKSSRHDLLFNLEEIKPNFIHQTKKFGDSSSLDSEKLSEIFCNTNFIPCPNGFFHPETYRLYEALECGCIPIVEDSYKYYDRLFPNNPFVKIKKWNDAKKIILSWSEVEINKKRVECSNWWINYQNKLQKNIKNKIEYEKY